MNKKRAKKYTPSPKYNPVVLSKRVDNDRKEINRLSNFFKSYDVSYSNHITYLGNFSRHDIKNAIQSIDSILSTTEASEFTAEIIESIASHLEVIRNTNENFAQLVPYSTDGTFTIDVLLNASQLLFRADMVKHEINIIYDYPKDSIIHIKLPFQSIVQVINNLLINCIKALEHVENKHILVKGILTDNDLIINIYDNGSNIGTENKNQVFDYGFSTTGGSGVGLFHAKSLCQNFKGRIELTDSDIDIYNKSFTIVLPIYDIYGEEHSNN